MFVNYDGFFVKIKILKVNKRLHFPYLSKVIDDEDIREEGNEYKSRFWTNDMEGEEIIVDRFTLETITKHHQVEYIALQGLYFNEGRNDKICQIIEFLFNKRLEYKKVKNPVQNLYKLMLNSAYGKTIEKAHPTKIKYFDSGKNITLGN